MNVTPTSCRTLVVSTLILAVAFTQFAVAETSPEDNPNMGLVWLTLEPGADIPTLLNAVEDAGGELHSLSPDGRLLAWYPVSSMASAASLPGVVSAVEEVRSDLQTDLKTAATAPEVAFGERPATPEEEEYLQDKTVSVDSVPPNTLSYLRSTVEMASGSLPSSVDNSLSMYFPPIRNQGGQGSCTTWAGCYYYGTYTQARDENLDAASGDNNYICSPSFVYPLINGGVDSGASTAVAVARMNEVGCASWAVWPYGSATAWPDEEAWIDGLKRRTTQLYVIGGYGCTDQELDALKQHLANGNIAATKTRVYENWYSYYPGSTTGINNEVLYASSGSSLGGHAMTIVGYDDNKSYNDGTGTKYGAFLLANSWGDGWGTYNTAGTSRGFMWVSYELWKKVDYNFGIAYYSDDLDDYRPELYAVTGINHSQRGYVWYDGGIGSTSSPLWSSVAPISNDGGTSISVTDANPIAVDLTDGIPYITDYNNVNLFVRVMLSSSASSGGSITSARFYQDFDGDGTYVEAASTDPAVTFSSGQTVYATATMSDDVPLTVTMTSTAPNPTNSSPITVSVTFSEAVTGFAVGDIIGTNAVVNGFTGSGADYSFTLSPSSQGLVTASIPADVCQDGAGSGNAASDEFSRTYDTAGPTVTLSSAISNPTNQSPMDIAATFSEAVTGFSVGDINVTNGSVEYLSGSGASYTFGVVPSGQGTVTVSVPSGVAQDAAGNGNGLSSELSRTYDTVSPSCAMTSTAPAITDSSPIPVSVAFSEAVSGFGAGDISVTNGTVANLTGSGASYTFDLVPAGDGTVTANIGNAAAADSAGNGNTAAGELSRLFDSAAPTVAISSTSPDPTNSSPIGVTVSFSEAVTGFGVDDIITSFCTVSNFTGSGSSYSFNLFPWGQGEISAQVAANSVQDGAGNMNGASSELTRVYDTMGPAPALSSTSSDPTSVSPIPVSVEFNEEVVGFSAGDLLTTNASVANFSGSGSSYSFSLLPTSEGQVAVQVPAGIAQDEAGNNNSASSELTRDFQVTNPTAVMNSTAGNPANSGTIPVTVTFSVSVTGFTASDIAVSNATVTNFSGSGTSYSFNLVADSDGEVTADIPAGAAQDGAGNPSDAASTFSRNVDTAAPSVTLASTAAEPTNTTPIPVTVTFSESVTGFTQGDLVPTNAAVTAFSGSGASYQFELAPSGQGAVSVALPAGVAADGAGNTNSAASALSRTFDNTHPTALMSSSTGNPTNSTSIHVTVTFSEYVTTFGASDLNVSNGLVSNFVMLRGEEYAFDLSPTAEGTVTVDIAAGVAEDPAGNPNLQASQFSRDYDVTAPVATLSTAASNPTNVAPVPVSVNFSEAVTGFTSSDLATTNATISDFTGSAASYSFKLVPVSDGEVSVRIPASKLADAAGNANGESSTLTCTVDRTPPTVTMSSTTVSPTNLSPIPVTVTFSEAVSGFTSSDLVVSNASISGFSGSGSVYTYGLVPSGEGEVTADIAAGVATDSAGNGNSACSQFHRTYDAGAPEVVLSSTAPSLTNGTIPVTVSFTEAVTGFTASDVSVGNGVVSGFTGDTNAYSFTITPSGDGQVTCSISSGRAMDAAGNGNEASNALSWTYDGTNPSVSLSTAVSNPTNQSVIPVTVTFSEPVTGFTASDITKMNASVGSFSGSGATYQFNMLPTGQGAASVSIVAGRATDAAGNFNDASNTVSRVYDSVAPVVAMNSVVSDPTNANPIPVTVTFSETVTGFTASDVTATNGSVSGFSGSGSAYSFNLVPAGNGQVRASIASSAAMDAAGNANSAGVELARTYDGTPPSVTMTSSATSPTNQQPISVSVTFSESVTGFSVSDITPVNASVSSLSGSGASYSFTLTPQSDGEVGADINGGKAQDAAGNGNTAAAPFRVVYDGTAPGVTLSSSTSNPTSTAPIPVSVTFTESVAGFTAGDVSVTNGSVSAFSGSGASYTLDIQPAGDGAISVSVGAGVAADSAGNGNTASSMFNRTFDGSTPTVTLSSTAPQSTNASPIPVTVMFSESVTGFSSSDIVVTNASVSGFSGSGASYSFNLNPSAQGVITASISANAAQDAAGNGNEAALELSRTYDTTAPTIAMASTAPSSTSASPIPVTVSFSEAVIGFSVGDLNVTNGSVSGFSGSGAAYSFNLVPASDGLVSVSIAAGAAQDSAGNGNASATELSRTYDSADPTVVMTSTAPAQTNTSPITVTVTFSEPVTGFNAADISTTSASVSGFSGSGAIYSFNLNPSTQGTLSARIAAGAAQDSAGNPNIVAPEFTRVYDTTKPSAALTTTAPNPVNAAPIAVQVVFTESVTGFAASDLSVTNAAVSSFTGSGTTYSFNLTPASDGAVSVSLPADAVQDAAGNGNSASAVLSRTFDTSRPTVTVASSASNPSNTSPIPVTVTFSESVTGFTAGDVTVINASVSGFAGSGADYSFNLSPTGQGVVEASIASNLAQDAAGNKNLASNAFSIAFDSAQPSVVLATTASDPTNSASIAVTATFSETVSGFASNDLSLSNATVSGFAGSGTSYSFNLLPSSEGAFSVNVPAGTAQDAAGNGNTASTPIDRTYDATRPGVAMSSTASDPTSDSPIPVTVTFTESVTGFAAGDIVATNASVSGFTGSGATYSFGLVPASAGAISAAIGSGVAQDSAGNTNTAATVFSITFDSTAPTVVMTSKAKETTKSSPISVTVIFSESVNGFTAGDLIVSNASVSGFTGSGADYEFDLTPASEGIVTADIPAGVAQDDTGNASSAAPQFSRVYDTTPPGVGLSTKADKPSKTTPIPVTVTFTESVIGFTTESISATNCTVENFSGSGDSYSFDAVPNGDGLVTVTIDADAAEDAATNGNTAATPLSVVYDGTAPTVTMSSTAPDPTNTAGIDVTVAFDEAVVGFTASDVTVTNAVLSDFSGADDTYTFTLTAAGDGDVTAYIPANVAADEAENPNEASQVLTRVYDSTAPVATFESESSEVTNAAPIVVTLTFDEAASALAAEDLTAVNASIDNFSEDEGTYTFELTPLSEGEISVSLAADTVQDAAGNGNAEPDAFLRIYDVTRPTVEIDGTEGGDTPAPVPLTATFSEPVTGFTAEDISVTNGTLATFSGSGAVYDFEVVAAGDGQVFVSIADHAATDTAGNTSYAADEYMFVYDSEVPTVRMETSASSPTNAATILVDVIFSEPVVGFTVADLQVVNGAVSGFTGSGAAYSFQLTPAAEGSVTVNIAAGAGQDAGGNLTAAAPELMLVYDVTPPTAALSTAVGNPVNSAPIPVTLQFSESVSGLTLADLSVTNGVVSNLTGGGGLYSLELAPSAQGEVSVRVPAAAVQDAAGNLNVQTPALTLQYDTQGVTVDTVTRTNANPANASQVAFEVVLTETVSGVDVTDFAVIGDGVNASVASVAGSGATYTVTLNNVSGDGTLGLQVLNNGSIVDGAGNSLVAPFSTGEVYEIDQTPPAAAEIGLDGVSPTNAASVDFTIHFTEAVVNLKASDFSVDGQGVTASIGGLSGSGADYEIILNGVQGDGTLSVDLAAAGTVTDLAGNALASPFTNGAAYTIDQTAPQVSMSSVASDPTDQSPLAITLKFSEDVSGFEQSDIIATNASVQAFAGSGDSYSFELVPATDGVVRAQVSTGAAQDAAGNASTAASIERTFDAAPTVTMTSSASEPTNTTPIPVVATFSEAVTGFVANDVVVGNAVISNFSGSGANYSFQLLPNAQGVVTAEIPAGVAQDAGGRTNAAAPQFSRTFASQPPTVTVEQHEEQQDPTTGLPILFRITFSAPVNGFTASDVVVAGTAEGVQHELSGSGADYTLSITAVTGDGTIEISVPEGAAQDEAGNGNEASTSVDNTVSYVRPRTFYVDTEFIGTSDGSQAHPYRSISEAVQVTEAYRGDTILVSPGIYDEDIELRPGTKLLSTDGAYNTLIVGTLARDEIDAITVADDATLRGFSVGHELGATAVYVPTGASAEITNCVLHGCNNGLYLGENSSVVFVNNAVYLNDTYGIFGLEGAKFDVFKNNIFANNGTAVKMDAAAIVDGSHNAFGNNTRNYDGPPPLPTDVHGDPLFVAPVDLNLHLHADSPCRDAGDPDDQYDDIDGSRNDIGPDGGPYGVEDELAPTARMMMTPSSGPAPLIVNFEGAGFEGLGSSDEWGIARYQWDFNLADSNPVDAEGPNVDWEFLTMGTYTVELTVTDNSGLSSSVTGQVHVGNGLPTAQASASPFAGPAPLTVAFHAEGEDPDDGPLSYEWDFNNDGVTDAAGADVNYTYPAGSELGAYRVMLTATDDEGASVEDLVSVTITEGDVLDAVIVQPELDGHVEVSDPGSTIAGLTLDIPAGAVSDEVVISVNEVVSPPPPPLDGFGVVAQFGPAGMVFSKPVRIVMPVPDEVDLSKGVDVLFYDEATGYWLEEGISDVEILEGTPRKVAFCTTHFTMFTVAREVNPAAQFSVASVSASESDGAAAITLRLDEPPREGQTLKVSYVTANGSATAGEDYTATSGTVTFTSEDIEQTVTISIMNDERIENVESFRVTLTTIQNGKTGEQVNVTVSIVDDDTKQEEDDPADPPVPTQPTAPPSGCAAALPSVDDMPTAPPVEMILALIVMAVIALSSRRSLASLRTTS